MSIAVSELVAMVSVKGATDAEHQLQNVGKSSDNAGSMLASLALGGAAIAGAALVGIGVTATKMAGDFQEGMTSLVTGAGESRKNIALVASGILNMAVQTGTSTKDLTAGMYMIESAGYHGAAGLSVLQASAEGAKVGAASLADVANGVTTAMTDYSSSGLTAAQATNTLIATVAAGKTHMGDLANSMATILPTAAAVKVGFMDVSGAMATMTGEGTNAASAATYLRQLLMALASPAKAGATALKNIGLTTAEVSTDMKKSLPDTLALIMKHLSETYTVGSPQYMTALKNIAGGSKQMQGILELTGEHMATFTGNVAGITDAVKKGGSSIQGWSDVQGDFNFKMSQAREVVETLMIKIGTQLLPVLTQLMGAVIPLITQFTNWITTSGVLQTAVTGITNAFSWMSNTVAGAFGYMQQQASIQSLKMKETSLTSAQQTASGVVAHLLEQRTGVEEALQHTAGDVQRHMLEMQIAAIDHSLKQEQGVVANYAKQKAGIDAQLQAMQPAVALHMLATKDKAVSTSLAQAEGVLGSYALQRRRLEAELSVTKDAVTRHMLEMKLFAVNVAIEHKERVVEAFEKQKAGVEKQITQMKSKVVAQNTNLILETVGLFNRMKDGVVQAWNNMVNSPAFHKLQDIMKSVADFLKSNFMPVWQQLVSVFQTQVIPSFKEIWADIQPLMPILELVGALIGGLLLVNIGILVSTLAGLGHALATFIGGISTALAGVFQFLKGLGEFVAGWAQFFVDLFTGHFDKLGGDLKNIWKGITDIFQGAGKIIIGLFQATIGTVVSYVWGFISTLISFFQHLWDELVGHSIIPDMVNGIIKFFENLVSSVISTISGWVADVIGWVQHLHDLAVEWITMMVMEYIVKAEALRAQVLKKIEDLVNGAIAWFVNLHNQAMQKLSDFVTGVLNWFYQLHDQAIQKMQDVIAGITGVLNNFVNGAASFGLTLLKNIASGITSGISNVKTAITNAVGVIGSFLPHSPAQEGELRHLNEYGPTIMTALQKGMESGIPALRATVSHVVAPLSQLGGAGSFSGSASPYAFPSMSSASGPITVIVQPADVNLDGSRLTTKMLPHLATAMRYGIGTTGR